MRPGHTIQQIERTPFAPSTNGSNGDVISEHSVVGRSQVPVTQQALERDLRKLGLGPGMDVLVHCSMSSLGWVCGGAQTVISALVNVVTPDGTIVMPAFTTWNTDPANWQNPPVPAEWHQSIREEMAPYIPQISPSRGVGRVAELFRSLPGVKRSMHPIVSVCAWGRLAHEITREHPLDCQFGERSPLGRLYELDGQVLSLGVRTNSTLHLSEHIGRWQGKRMQREGCSMLIDGQRRWVEFEDLASDDSDFIAIKDEFERDTEHTLYGKVGSADSRLVRVSAMVDYGAWWMEQHRNSGNNEASAAAAAG
ncbi:AAC(3) family N-acetyltransferase [bacterium]|nr:AAC(3) family N-acetyltransferase [bacterium]